MLLFLVMLPFYTEVSMTFKKYYVKFNSLIQYCQYHFLGRLIP